MTYSSSSVLVYMYMQFCTAFCVLCLCTVFTLQCLEKSNGLVACTAGHNTIGQLYVMLVYGQDNICKVRVPGTWNDMNVFVAIKLAHGVVIDHYFTKMPNGKKLCLQGKEIKCVYKQFVGLENHGAIHGTLKRSLEASGQ